MKLCEKAGLQAISLASMLSLAGGQGEVLARGKGFFREVAAKVSRVPFKLVARRTVYQHSFEPHLTILP